MRDRALRLSLFVLVLLGVGCDHATKHAAAAHLRGGPAVELLPGLLSLRYAENFDVGFHLLRAIPDADTRRLVILGFGMVMVTVLLALWLGRRLVPAREQLGFALLLAGAIGNLLDRVFRGYVVDFIHLQAWPVFNVADVCICVGGALLAWTAWRDQSTRLRASTGT